ncbi:protein MesA [Niveomyces insectorum RCEF 264]|uniref:Protein MesA n=1 Tax=Niveomyces insectorum RCEF 264 TaxID=1081102 RepID=A0A167RHV3_9HYPO|nr:protein MesA [Niveomyces insectorum RCEF 264]
MASAHTPAFLPMRSKVGQPPHGVTTKTNNTSASNSNSSSSIGSSSGNNTYGHTYGHTHGPLQQPGPGHSHRHRHGTTSSVSGSGSSIATNGGSGSGSPLSTVQTARRTSFSSFPSSSATAKAGPPVPTLNSPPRRPARSPQPPHPSTQPPPIPGAAPLGAQQPAAAMAEADRTSNQSNKSTKAPSSSGTTTDAVSASPPRHSPASSSEAAAGGGGRGGRAIQQQHHAHNNHGGTEPRRRRKLRPQYPRGSTENHVEYILVASFDVDRGPVMEHQYPVAITGDEHMLAELMLPDQTHLRNQDWTMFFLHKDVTQEEEEQELLAKEARRKRRRRRRARLARRFADEHHADEHRDSNGYANGASRLDDDDDKNNNNEDEHAHDNVDDDFDDDDDDDDYMFDDDVSTDSEPEGGEGAPLIYVLNLVNTKQDKTQKRGAVVKSMAICTRHPFLHIYKPLLLLALEEYFKSPVPETLSMLYDAVNAMDLSLMPKLSLVERHLLQASDNKDIFVEKFEQMVQMRLAEEEEDDDDVGVTGQPFDASRSPPPRPAAAGILRAGTKAHFEGQAAAYAVPRDTHEFESKVFYKGIPIPIKVPVAAMPETVGDFSLIKLIQNFAEPHAKAPQPFPLHAHLTTNGPTTHPIIVLVNALLTQKRVIFLGHNMPSGEGAEAVLAACALASGGVLRGFTRHAFPYTDLTKIDDLLLVPGFIAGVTNPTFELHPEWWDLLCDLPSGRMKISSRIEEAPVTEGQLLFKQQQHPAAAVAALVGTPLTASPSAANSDLTGDQAFMADILKSVAARLGERVVRAKWRDWVVKFTRIAAAFEESVYGTSVLNMDGGGSGADPQTTALSPTAGGSSAPPSAASGHGYVWPDDVAKQRELAGNVTRIEGWRNTRSYQSFIKDVALLHSVRPLKDLDLHHMHDRLRTQKLTPAQSRDIYLTLARAVHGYDEICLLLTVAPEAHGGLFYVALGLFHKDRDVRTATAELLARVGAHEAGQHWWRGLSRFEKLAFARIRREAEAEQRSKLDPAGVARP